MFHLLAEFTDSGKKYTFDFKELTKGVLTDEQIAKIEKIALTEINKL